MNYKIIGAGIVCLLAIAVVVSIYLRSLSKFNTTTYLIKEVHSNTAEETIYIKRKNWGLSGDKQIVVISKNDSKSKIETADTSNEYVYQDLGDIYYKVSNDTLYILTFSLAPDPTRFNSKFTIVQKQYDMPELNELHGKYKFLGYEKI